MLVREAMNVQQGKEGDEKEIASLARSVLPPFD